MTSMKCDHEQLVSYLYDDLLSHERAAFERHLRECAACRGELSAFRGLRLTLSAWAPPRPELALSVADARPERPPSVVSIGTAVGRGSWRAWWMPAAGLAAAAVLVMAAASALAHVEIRYGADGFAVRTGWNTTTAAAPAAAVIPSSPAPAEAQQLEASYADIERRLRDLEAESRRPVAQSPLRAVSQVTPANRASDAEILARVRDLLAQSESRQQRELAIRIAQVLRDVDAQRTADLSRIQQGLGKIDAMTTADAAAHRELANYLITSTRQQK